MSMITFIIYSILYLLLSPFLAVPLLFIFCFMPILILNIPRFLWMGCRWMLFPTPSKQPIPATTPTVLVSPFPKRPHKPRPKRSKMAGIRRNRALLDIARGRNATSASTSTIADYERFTHETLLAFNKGTKGACTKNLV